MQKAKILLSITLVVSALTLSGCTFSLGGKSSNDFGGMFVSANKGESWQRKNNIPTSTGNPQSIGDLNIYTIEIDPSDPAAIYAGSLENGLFYSYNNTSDWNYAARLGKETIIDIAINPKDKCTIYAAIGNRLYRSEDCNRTWNQVYYDNDPAILVYTIVIDHYDSNVLYFGTSRGEIVKSTNKGESWQTLTRLDQGVKELAISPQDSRVLYAMTSSREIFRTDDAGDSWKDISKSIKEVTKKIRFRDLEVAKDEPGVIFIAADYGIFKSTDHGNTWEQLQLITPEKEAVINSIAVSPKNNKEIYYVTNTTFYRSIDGGQNWATKKLPTGRAGWSLAINPENDSIIYLTARTIN